MTINDERRNTCNFNLLAHRGSRHHPFHSKEGTDFTYSCRYVLGFCSSFFVPADEWGKNFKPPLSMLVLEVPGIARTGCGHRQHYRRYGSVGLSPHKKTP
eukprot:scaffold83773_cov17-Prasinocladus_malaysianus.AAC.1